MWTALAGLILGLLRWLCERSTTDYDLVEGDDDVEGGNVDLGDYPDL